jgi:hypothetical protein
MPPIIAKGGLRTNAAAACHDRITSAPGSVRFRLATGPRLLVSSAAERGTLGCQRQGVARLLLQGDGSNIFTEASSKVEANLYLDRAGEVFELVKDVIPADKKTIGDVASAINGLGNVYYGRGDFEKAIDNYRLATTLVPDTPTHGTTCSALTTR